MDRAAAEYPVTVRMERTDAAHAGQQETVKARYVVGCDGARSAVRTSIGRQLVGDSANQAWGVMDVLALTDFPDIRYKAAVQSANGGNLLVIPREGDYLVRLYVEVDNLGEHQRVADRGLDADDIIGKARRIFSPFELDVKEVVWWSIYEIGHRLTDKFDDVPADQVAQHWAAAQPTLDQLDANITELIAEAPDEKRAMTARSIATATAQVRSSATAHVALVGSGTADGAALGASAAALLTARNQLSTALAPTEG